MRTIAQISAIFALCTGACSASPLMMNMGGMIPGMGGGGGDTGASGGAAGGCPALQLVFARGTTEMQGTLGVVGKPLCTGLQAQVPNTACYDVVYSSNAEYMMTVAAGGQTANAFIMSLKSRCPDAKVVLGGYSKGGMVCHRISGSSGTVVGAVTFGDPLKTQPMPSTSAWKTFCAVGDPVCQAGFNVMAHLSYGQNIATAVSFLVNAYRSGGGGAGGSAIAGAAQGAAPAAAGSASPSGASGLFGGGALAKMMGARDLVGEHPNPAPVLPVKEHDVAVPKRRSPTFGGLGMLQGLGGMDGGADPFSSMMGGGMGGMGGGGGAGSFLSNMMSGAMSSAGSSPLMSMMGGGTGAGGASANPLSGLMGSAAGSAPATPGTDSLVPGTSSTAGMTPGSAGAGIPYGASGAAPASAGTPAGIAATGLPSAAGAGSATGPGAAGLSGASGAQGAGMPYGSQSTNTGTPSAGLPAAGGAASAGAPGGVTGAGGLGGVSKSLYSRSLVKKRQESVRGKTSAEKRSPLAMAMPGLGGTGGGDPFANMPDGRGFQTPDVTRFFSLFPNGAESPLTTGLGGGGGGLGGMMPGLGGGMPDFTKLMGGGMLRKRHPGIAVETHGSAKKQDGSDHHHRGHKHRKHSKGKQ